MVSKYYPIVNDRGRGELINITVTVSVVHAINKVIICWRGVFAKTDVSTSGYDGFLSLDISALNSQRKH